MKVLRRKSIEYSNRKYILCSSIMYKPNKSTSGKENFPNEFYKVFFEKFAFYCNYCTCI